MGEQPRTTNQFINQSTGENWIPSGTDDTLRNLRFILLPDVVFVGAHPYTGHQNRIAEIAIVEVLPALQPVDVVPAEFEHERVAYHRPLDGTVANSCNVQQQAGGRQQRVRKKLEAETIIRDIHLENKRTLRNTYLLSIPIPRLQ